MRQPVAIYSLNHKYISKAKHPPGLAQDHLRYVLRKSACVAVEVANLDMPTIGSRGGPARTWLQNVEGKARKNGRVIDKIMVALPIELRPEQQIELVRVYMAELTGSEGIRWLAAFHDMKTEDHNPHCHIIVEDKGLSTGKRVVEFSERGSTHRLRETWETVCNRYLAQAGSDARIDRRSLKAQREEIERKLSETTDPEQRAQLRAEFAKVDRKPSGHEGPEPRTIEANGEISTKLERLRQVREENAAQRELEDEMYEVFSALLQVYQTATDNPPVEVQSELDRQLDAEWDRRFSDRHLRAGLIAVLAQQGPHLSMHDIYWRAEDIIVSAEFNPKHPMNDKTALLTEIGQNTLRGGWRKLDALAAAIRANVAQSPPLPSQRPSETPEGAGERPGAAQAAQDTQRTSRAAKKPRGAYEGRTADMTAEDQRAEAEILDALFCAFERQQTPDGDGWDRTRNPALEWKMALALRALDEQQAELRRLLGERFKLPVGDPRAFRIAITSMKTGQFSALVTAVDELDNRIDREPGRNWKSRRQTFHQMIERYGAERVLRREGESPSRILRTTIKGLCEHSGLANFYRNTLKPLVSRLVDAVRSKQAPRFSQQDPEVSPKPKGSEPGM